jgi:cytidylate kinase
MSLITVTQNIGCGAIEIARQVAAELGLEVYDDHRLGERAVEMGIQPEELKKMAEKPPGVFSRMMSNKPEAYLDLLQAVVYEVARRGEGIIFGHGSQVLLRDFGCALHVRIFASESTRISTLIAQSGLDRAAAKKMIHKSDSEQRGFLRYSFHMDWNDPSLYDVVINRDKLSAASAARIIIETARSQEITACSRTALDSMERLSLVRKIQAEILKNNLEQDLVHIEVPEKGVAHVSGLAYSEEVKERFLKIVAQVEGVGEVRSNLNVIPPGVA